jgi:hypothetical protein
MNNRIQELIHSSAFALLWYSNLIGAKKTNESLVALSTEELRKRWQEIGAVVWPSILERVKAQQPHENSKFEKEISSVRRRGILVLLSVIMSGTMRAEYADGKPTNKFASPYFGPICITDVDKRGNYRGYEMENNKVTRWFQPTHLKPYSRPSIALDQRTNIKGHGFDYLVSYDDGSEYWMEGEYLEREFINEFKEGQKLKAIAKESTIQKKKKIAAAKEKLAKHKEEALRLQTELEEMEE